MQNQKFLKPNIQLFAEEGNGEGNSAPNAGNGNANQNSGNAGTSYTQEQLDSIVSERVGRVEKSALKSFFSQQGMSEQEITQAINDYKTAKQNSQPNIADIQAQLLQAQQDRNNAVIQQSATIEAVKLGVDVNTIPYLLKLADFSQSLGEDGKVNTQNLTEALNKVLTDIPQLKPNANDNNNGFQQIGGDSNAGNQNANTSDILSSIFGNTK